MNKLGREDLMSLEQYAANRSDFRKSILEHKKTRQVHLGEHATLYFEDRLTMQYQIQEMLRIERIFEPEAIQEELDAYNPLIPDGTNLKATFMVEYGDVEERKQALQKLINIEDHTWLQVKGFDKVYAIADEDLERETEDKTSAVHFMRFQLSNEMIEALKAGADLSMGIDHENYLQEVNPVPPAIRNSLVQDLELVN